MIALAFLENLQRKDLTEYERSRTLVARIEVMREIAKQSEPLIRAQGAQIRNRAMVPVHIAALSNVPIHPRQRTVAATGRT